MKHVSTLLGTRGNRLTFQIPSNKLQVSVTYDCIAKELNNRTTSYDALVIPSNQWMSGNANQNTWWFSGRSNVDGKIREMCGIELTRIIQQMKQETHFTKPTKETSFLPPGTVRTTPAPHLNVQYLLHTVGPSCQTSSTTSTTATTLTLKKEEKQLEETYARCLQVAENLDVRSLLVPAISTGVFRMPFPLSAQAAIRAIEQHPQSTCGTLQNINFVVLEHSGAALFANEFDSAWKTNS